MIRNVTRSFSRNTTLPITIVSFGIKFSSTISLTPNHLFSSILDMLTKNNNLSLLISETATSMFEPSSILYLNGISLERNKAVTPFENSTI